MILFNNKCSGLDCSLLELTGLVVDGIRITHHKFSRGNGADTSRNNGLGASMVSIKCIL